MSLLTQFYPGPGGDSGGGGVSSIAAGAGSALVLTNLPLAGAWTNRGSITFTESSYLSVTASSATYTRAATVLSPVPLITGSPCT